MNAKEFDGTSDWGLSFTIWKSEFCTSQEEFSLKVKKSDELGDIMYLFDKIIYNLDKKETLRLSKRQTDASNFISLKSALHLNTKNKNTNYREDALGSIIHDSATVRSNNQGVCLFSTNSEIGNLRKDIIVEDNFLESVTIFCSRRLVSGKYATWINWYDEYMAPNESHPLWKQFQYDFCFY